MTKGELVDRMADAAGITKVSAEKALNGFLDGVKKALTKRQKVTLVGFGTFSVNKRKGRMGRNPQTGATIRIPAKSVPKFTAGRELKDAVK